jgi:hypothetical protein
MEHPLYNSNLPSVKTTIKSNVPIVTYSSPSNMLKEPKPILPIINTEINNSHTHVESQSEDKYQDLVNAIKSIPSSQKTCKSNTIYVDLACFMEKMNSLRHHSSNMMVDLSLLTSNLKTCSYVKKIEDPKSPSSLSKDSSPNSSNKNDELISNVAKSLTMPKPDTVKLINQPATILMTTGSSNPLENNLTLGVRETFENVNNNDNRTLIWLVIVIIVIIILLFFLLNKN